MMPPAIHATAPADDVPTTAAGGGGGGADAAAFGTELEMSAIAKSEMTQFRNVVDAFITSPNSHKLLRRKHMQGG